MAFTPILISTSMTIKHTDLKSSTTYSSLKDDSTDEEILSLAKAIDKLQEKELDYVIKTKRYELVEI